jgi:hypothetical protein
MHKEQKGKTQANDAQPMQIPDIILIELLLPLWHRDTKKGEEHATRPGEN